MQHRFNKLAASSPAEFDYVIIGAGSAGSAIAYRLGEDKSISIALIEYGGSDAGPFI
jgi:choline dehydrogenase